MMQKKVQLVITVYILFMFSLKLYAQQKQADIKKQKFEPTKPAIEIQKTNDTKQYSNIIFAMSGGYFSPLGTESVMLNGSWMIKSFIQQNNIENTLFGIGGDLLYTKLQDKKYDGYIMYVTFIPNATAVFPLYKNLMVILKAGPGFTVLHSHLNDLNESSLSMTLAAGAGLFIIISQQFIWGIENMYHYYFQIHASSSLSYYSYIGYRW
ncbi:MAG: hypothetical protein N3F66_00780 [Spirochaetes bacterium]|nr:hypothetical protein [Spirochaetota bacterium]